MMISRLARGLLALGITSLLGCSVTMSELKALNPGAATLKVHCRPWKIPEHVQVFAARSSGEHVHTDEAPGALRDFAEHAGVFIEVDASAPRDDVRLRD